MISYGYFSTVLNDNVQSRVALTLSLVQHHSVDITAQARFTQDKAFVDGHYYSDKAPGLSLLAVPAAAVLVRVFDPGGAGAAWVASDTLTARYGIFVYFLTLATVSTLASLVVAATYYWTIRQGGTPEGALFAASALGFATPFFGWATVFVGHVAAGSLLLLGFLGLAQAGQAPYKSRSPLVAFGAGIALGMAFCVEFPAGPAVAIIGVSCACVALAADERRTAVARAFVPATIGLILAVTPLAVYNDLAFHSPFKLGYESVQDFPGMKQGIFGVRLPDPRIAWELMGGTFRGLIPLSPVLILFPAAVFLTFKDRTWRLPAIVGLLVPAYYLAMNAGYYYWDGGSSTGPRHLIPALPFMALLLGRLWDAGRPIFRVAFLGLFGISLLISLVCTSVDVMAPPNLAHPFTDYLLPAFLEGRLHRVVIGRVLPIDNALPLLIPLLLLWAIVALLLLACHKRATVNSV